MKGAPKVRTGVEVPITGIWSPIDIPNGCPNHLYQGNEAPPAKYTQEKCVWPARPHWDPPLTETVEYEYARKPTRWQLLWEDRRYEGGVVPDESELLDEDNDFPPTPPPPPTTSAPNSFGGWERKLITGRRPARR